MPEPAYDPVQLLSTYATPLLPLFAGELKLCDFGLARYFQPGMDGSYTPKVVTLWYRAPELLFGSAQYTAAVDMWAVGCILAEFLKHEPVFPGRTEADTLSRIVKLLGSPNEKIWPGWSKLPKAGSFVVPNQPYNYLVTDFPRIKESGTNLLNNLLMYDPRKRFTAEQALSHPYFAEAPRPKRVEDMPSFPSLHAPMPQGADKSGGADASERAKRGRGFFAGGHRGRAGNAGGGGASVSGEGGARDREKWLNQGTKRVSQEPSSAAGTAKRARFPAISEADWRKVQERNVRDQRFGAAFGSSGFDNFGT